MALHWVVCNPYTGKRLVEFDNLYLASSLSGFIGQGEGAQVKLPIMDRMPGMWRQATEPYRTLFVCYYDDPNETILWVGTVTSRTWGSDPFVTLNLSSVEDWLDRQYITGSFKNMEQTRIIRKVGLGLLASQFNGYVEEHPTGVLRQRTYLRADDMTALRAMQNLMSVIDGAEWCVRWRWGAGRRLQCVPYVGARVGRTADALGNSIFTVRAAEWSRTQDYSHGKGANVVTATAPRMGNKRPESSAYDMGSIAAGYLPAEYRWSPNTGSNKPDILHSYAERRLADMRRGNVELSVKLHVDDLVIGSSALHLGDDIKLSLVNEDFPSIAESSIQRLVGWTIDADAESGQPTFLTPIMLSSAREDIITDSDIGDTLDTTYTPSGDDSVGSDEQAPDSTKIPASAIYESGSGSVKDHPQSGGIFA